MEIYSSAINFILRSASKISNMNKDCVLLNIRVVLPTHLTGFSGEKSHLVH